MSLDVEQWVVRAQDGHAGDVLAQTRDVVVDAAIPPRLRARALYARALAHAMLGQAEEASAVAREASTFCRDHGLPAAGLLARTLLLDLLRRQGRLEEAVEQLARAVALEPGLRDVQDGEVQAALGALAVALRAFGVPEEARRVEARLAAVEPLLPLHQRVARWSNLAFEHAVAGMAACRLPPHRPDGDLLDRAVEEIARAVALAEQTSYGIVVEEAQVLRALAEAASSRGGTAEAALARLDGCRSVLARGAEAVPAQLLWGAARVRALARLGRDEEAAEAGRAVLADVTGSGEAGDRLVLAYEVLLAEHPGVQLARTGASAFVALAEERVLDDEALLGALFRARVDLLRGADERRVLARAASLDSLTGLVNRRGATTVMRAAAARPAGEDVALLLVDLDNFKVVNDSCGHLAGDVVLQAVAGALRTAARTEDLVARWGGDEFVVVADLDEGAAAALAERLRERVRETGEPASADAVTASVGVAVRREPLDEDGWLRRADLAMYAAKRSGGDATMVG